MSEAILVHVTHVCGEICERLANIISIRQCLSMLASDLWKADSQSTYSVVFDCSRFVLRKCPCDGNVGRHVALFPLDYDLSSTIHHATFRSI
jgi:hypothetical protein